MYLTVPNTSIALLGNITLKSNYQGNDLVYFVQERVNEMPAFLPYSYDIPALCIRLNLVRARNNDLYEFGGSYGEEAVCGYLSYLDNTISVTFTTLKNKPILASFEQKEQTHLQIA